MTANQTLESIPELVLEYWKDYQKPWLLASLGGRIGAEAREVARKESATLGDYIELRFPDDVRIVTIPGHDKAAVPKDRTEELTDADLVNAFKSKRGRVASKRSYARNVWKAFYRPIAQGRRYVELRADDEPLIHEESDQHVSCENWYEVLPSDLQGIVGLTGADRTKAIESAIMAWAEKSSIDLDRLSALRESKETHDAIAPKSEGIGSLVQGLLVLEPSELARISIPGDVFLSVLRRLS